MELAERSTGNGIIVLDIRGQIDMYDAPEIKNFVKDKIQEQKVRLILNFENVTFIDSSGIGALISSLTALKKQGGCLKIFRLAGNVRKVFDITKLTLFFEIFETEEEALKSFDATPDTFPGLPK